MRASWDTNAEILKDRKCEKCGKIFTPAVYHQFVDYINNGAKRPKRIYYCSWTCYNHRKKKVRKGKSIYLYDLEGNFIEEFSSANAAAMYMGDIGISISNKTIQACARGELAAVRGGFVFKYTKE